ncbi:MAG: class I SAM-dependent methyltransferase [Acidimicrobiia bacterium]|nr:class I SAM-dependent methyltransferase [Acidimicrobiia bacterium]
MVDWWPNDERFVGAEHLDATFVEAYDSKAQFDPTDDIDLLVRHGLARNATVIDLGAGTGTFAAAAAETGATVIAVDPSPAMAEAIRSKSGFYPNLVVVEAGMLSYQHDGEPVDFVYSRNALHQLPEFWKVIALQRIAQLLTDGGLFLLRDIVYDIPPHEIVPTIDGWLAAAPSDPASGYTRADLRTHIMSEYSTFSWLLESALQRTGFEIVHKSVRRSVYATYLCRR